jgi:hypothetical protein
MRAAPTAVFSGQTYTNSSTLTAGGLTPTGTWVTAAITASGTATVTYAAALTAEL